MQEIYNAGWYATNEVCSWPFTATLYSIEGIKFSDSILSDLRIVTTGTSIFYLSGVQITDNFVSIVISSEQRIAAAVTIKQPVNIHRNYVLNPFTPGLSGTVAFGHGVLMERGSWHFDPGENILDGACVRLNTFPVSSLSIEKGSKLTGRVLLESGTDLNITPCTVSLGYTRSEGSESAEPGRFGAGYKISLSSDSDRRATVASSQTDILAAYAGACQMRPENGDCPYITEINGVTPDQDGNIDIKVQGGASLSLNQVLIPVSEVLPGFYSCSDNGLYSNTILIASDEPYASYTASTPVRRCGRDLCDTDRSSSADSSSSTGNSSSSESSSGSSAGNLSFSSDSWSMRTASQSAAIITRDDNYGVLYRTERDSLEPAGDGAAYVYFSTAPHTTAFAAFNLQIKYDCGIIYNLNTSDPESIHLFRFTGANLSLGKHVISPVPGSLAPNNKISLSLSYSNGFFKGIFKLYTGGKVYSEELTLSGNKTGIFGLYMKNCKCLMWGEQ